MPTDSVPQTTNSSYAGLPVTKAPNWHGLVAWDVLLNGLATGLFMVTGLCVLVDHAVFAPVASVAFPVAWILITADLVCLVLDLGDPLRFHHMLRVFKPSSPMSLGVWAIGGFGFFATVATFLYLLPIDNVVFDAARWTVFGIGFVLAMASAMYKGVLFSTTAQPVWRDGRWLGGYFTGTALVLGCAELLFLAIVLGNEPATHFLRHAFALLLGISIIPQALLLLDIRPALVRYFTRETRLSLGAAVLLGGVVVPLGLLLASGAPAVLVVAIALVLFANVIGRFAIVYIPHALHGPLPEGG